MRIIDKNHDFYDYLQSHTDTLVFDRRNSFLLTKEMVCEIWRYGYDRQHKLLLLQCGSSFWLMLLTATKYDESYFRRPIDYSIDLLDHWQNYNKQRKCISIASISCSYGMMRDKEKICSSVDKLRYAIDHNNYKTEYDLSRIVVTKDHKIGYSRETRDIPLLKACGISKVIDPRSIFCAIEEYFSMEKTASERTEPLGVTNDDKIVMHGFDTKKSFRG